MKHIFVWTFNDIVGLVFFGLTIIVILCVFVYQYFKDILSRWRKRERGQ